MKKSNNKKYLLPPPRSPISQLAMEKNTKKYILKCVCVCVYKKKLDYGFQFGKSERQWNSNTLIGTFHCLGLFFFSIPA